MGNGAAEVPANGAVGNVGETAACSSGALLDQGGLLDLGVGDQRANAPNPQRMPVR
jgi:hypothetical protein